MNRQLITYDVWESSAGMEEDVCYQGEGNYLRVEDLQDWIDWHLRNRPIESIYSDLDKALKGNLDV